MYRRARRKYNKVRKDGPEESEIWKCYYNARIVMLRHHEEAVKWQNIYQVTIAFAISCLFTAFLVLSIDISFKISDTRTVAAIYSTELALLIVSLTGIFLGRRALTLWIKRRAISEMLRQFLFFRFVLSQEKELTTGETPEKVMDEAAETLEQEIIPAKLSECSATCRKFFRATLDGTPLVNGQGVENKASMEFYLQARVRRQLTWFRHSAERLADFLETRERLLVGFFALALIAASTKFVHYAVYSLPYFEVAKPTLTLISLVALALTAGLAALLIVQGAQPLRSRYTQQASEIVSINDSLTADYRNPKRRIEQFERLMLDELVFFIHQYEGANPEISL